MNYKLKESLHKVRMLGYDLWDKKGDCNSEYCIIERANHKLEKLNYMMEISIENEEYEVCNRIKNEINFRNNNNIGEIEMVKIKNKRNEILRRIGGGGKKNIIDNKEEWILEIIK